MIDIARGRMRQRYWAASVLASAALATTIFLPQAAAAFRGTTDTTTVLSTGTFPTYSQLVVAANPLGYYRLDDTAGTTLLADSSGHANPAQLVHTGQYFRRPGSPAGGSDTGRAVTLPGSTTQGYLAGRDQLNLSPAVSTTFETWLRTTGTSGVLMELADVASGIPAASDRVLSLTASGALQFRAMGKTLTSGAVNDGQWHLTQAILAPGALQLYVDGSLAASETFTGTPTMSVGYVRAGGDGTWFTGDLDGTAVYNAQLPASSVTAHWNSGAQQTVAGYTAAVRADSPWALWNLDDVPAGPWGQRDYDYPVALADSGSQNHPAIAHNLPPNAGALGQPGALSGGSSGTAIRMDGSGWAYSTTQIAVPNTFTSELWFRTTTTTGGLLSVFTTVAGATCHRDSSEGNYACGRMLLMNQDGTVSFGIQPSGTFLSVKSSRALNDGQWHYAVATIVVPTTGTTAELRLYIDNALEASATVNKPSTFTGYYAFGGGGLPYNGTWPASASFNGMLDEVAFYASTLSQSMMSQHWYAKTRT